MSLKRRKAARPPEEKPEPAESEVPERRSAQRKIELVLRLLRGEALDAVSRESQVPGHEPPRRLPQGRRARALADLTAQKIDL